MCRHQTISLFSTILLVVLFAGCAPPPDATGQGAVPAAPTTPATPPPQNSENAQAPPARMPMRAAPTATLPDGWVITLELAESPEEIQNGLMFRPSLPEDRGMLFVFDVDRVPSFWMKNTLIPLDLVFLAADGTVADLILDVRPCKVDPCPQYIPRMPVRAVLEIAAGSAEAHGLAIGQQLSIEGVRGYPE
jgi:uncharacterized membrane protein (UPF0127 family)